MAAAACCDVVVVVLVVVVVVEVDEMDLDDVDVTPHIATSYRFEMVRDHITTPFSFLVGWQYGRGPF